MEPVLHGTGVGKPTCVGDCAFLAGGSSHEWYVGDISGARPCGLPLELLTGGSMRTSGACGNIESVGGALLKRVSGLGADDGSAVFSQPVVVYPSRCRNGRRVVRLHSGCVIRVACGRTRGRRGRQGADHGYVRAARVATCSGSGGERPASPGESRASGSGGAFRWKRPAHDGRFRNRRGGRP